MRAFTPGQRWTYRTRPGEDTSTLLILAREDSPAGGIVHIRVEGLRLRTTHGEQSDLPHTPLAEASLRASVLELVEDGVPLPADTSGLQHWEAAYARGEAGFFTLDVAAVVAAVEEMVGGAPAAEDDPLFRKANRK